MEVVIAVALIGGTVTVILSLLGPLLRQNGAASDALVAQGLTGSVQCELKRLATENFDAFAAAVPAFATPMPPGLVFFANRDGTRLHSGQFHAPQVSVIPEPERF